MEPLQNSTPTPPNSGRYILTISKRLGDQVLEWVIRDTVLDATVAQGDAMGYPLAVVMVIFANAGFKHAGTIAIHP